MSIYAFVLMPTMPNINMPVSWLLLFILSFMFIIMSVCLSLSTSLVSLELALSKFMCASCVLCVVVC